uniref:Coat protein n=1 Tax=Gengado virus TaxID=2689362 RepID=A0A6B9KNX7_9VIRU|nr:coat protein [Gengado virus]
MQYLPELAAAVPAVLQTINEFLPSSPVAQPNANDSSPSRDVPPAQLAVAPAVQHHGLPQQPNPRTAFPGLVVPFQSFIHRHKGDHKFISLTLESVPFIASQLNLSQVVEVLEAEICIFPTQNALTTPATIAVAWTPANLAPDVYSVSSVYGAQQVSFGGSYHLNGFTIPCDLTAMNPIIKSPVSFNNTPRFSINCWLNPAATRNSIGSLADIYVRGKLRLSVPSLSIGAPTPA